MNFKNVMFGIVSASMMLGYSYSSCGISPQEAKTNKKAFDDLVSIWATKHKGQVARKTRLEQLVLIYSRAMQFVAHRIAALALEGSQFGGIDRLEKILEQLDAITKPLLNDELGKAAFAASMYLHTEFSKIFDADDVKYNKSPASPANFAITSWANVDAHYRKLVWQNEYDLINKKFIEPLAKSINELSAGIEKATFIDKFHEAYTLFEDKIQKAVGTSK